MNKFEFKNLVKSLEKSLKEKTFFKTLRKEVNTGANGTQDYVVKKGINKDTIALASEAGADTFVAGSAIFNTENYEQTISELRSKIV